MKQLLNYKSIALVGLITITLLAASCKKFLGLPLQENDEHTTAILEEKVNMTAWDYIKARSFRGTSFNDTIMKRMYDAIIYSEIDTTEYLKPKRTFILLHNDAIFRRTGTTTTTDCYFGKYRVNNVAATRWEQYSKLQVKNYLLSLIVEGEHSFFNVTPDPKFVTTLMPLNTDPLNPESLMAFRVVNDRDSRFRINDFPGSQVPTANTTTPGIPARTSNLISNNGPMHVYDRVVFFERR